MKSVLTKDGKTVRILCMQMGFGPLYPDVATLATTYNDGIYYIASFLRKELPEAQVEMCQMYWGEDPRDFPLEEYDFILISALATQFWSNLDLLSEIGKRKKTGGTIVMGGPHATFAPYEALDYVDYVILGEGEIPALKLIQRVMEKKDLDDVENLCYLEESGRMVMNRFARFGSLENPIDPTFLSNAPRLHWATISMSRGCPYDCSFCYAIRILGRRFRPKSPESIASELRAIHEITGCRRFYVTDLNFTTRPDFCRKVAREVAGEGYHFIAMSRVEIADEKELVLTLQKSGFREYCLGVESPEQGVLEEFNKRVDPGLQTDRLNRLAEFGVLTHSAIIYGLDRQDRASIESTARWCADARIIHPTFVCLAEYPFQKELYGSRQDVEDHRIIMRQPTYQHYSFVGIYPRHMRASTLQKLIIKSYRLFFDRALELERSPRRRARLKSYEKSVQASLPGMVRNAETLEKLEKPYYTAEDSLREEMLKRDFADQYGGLRERLRNLVRDRDLVKSFSA